jgi:hypothetical protein
MVGKMGESQFLPHKNFYETCAQVSMMENNSENAFPVHKIY